MSKETENIIPGNGSVLFIDVGNSAIKFAYLDGMEWHIQRRIGTENTDPVVNWINERNDKFQLVIISSVVEKVTEMLTDRIQVLPCRVLSVEDIPGDLLDYRTPETLGIDRFFACYGAVAYSARSSVVIDCGTACTIDLMTDDYVFRGGVILPGIAIIEKALKAYAPALPAVARSLPDEWPGKSTRTSLQWGVTGAFLDGIHAILERYENRFGSFELVLTGGDAEWLSSKIERESKVCPALVFEGMKCFLEDYL